jgi:hypothetical protein
VYYYKEKDDISPKGVIFLTGSIIEAIKDEKNELRGYYGFELLHQDMCTGEHHRHEKRVLYCNSEEDRDVWISRLQHSAHVVPIEEDYVIGMIISIYLSIYCKYFIYNSFIRMYR